MGFLLFLPAYMHSPGGIIISGPKREREHKVGYVEEAPVPTQLSKPPKSAVLIEESTLTPHWGPTPPSPTEQDDPQSLPV